MNESRRLNSIVITGGGISGWLSATSVAAALRGQRVEIAVVDFCDEPDPPVIQALPIIKSLLQDLQIPEQQMMDATKGSFSLGTDFHDWVGPGRGFFLPQAPHGASIEFVPFHQYAVKARANGDPTPLRDWSLCARAALAGKFIHPATDPESVLSTLQYGYHLDSRTFEAFLKNIAVSLGVQPVMARVQGVERKDNGLISALQLDNGKSLEGDFFLDCSGASSVLAGGALDIPFVDWTGHLQVDRSMTVSRDVMPNMPYSEITAIEGGWMRRLSSRSRAMAQVVYCHSVLDDDRAAAALGPSGPGNPEPEPAALRCGHREQFWTGNCVALGAAGGQLDPVAGADIAILQAGIIRLLGMLPDRDFNPLLADEFNRLTTEEFANSRDYMLLHYQLSDRQEPPFGNDGVEIPATLAHKMNLFRERGQVVMYENEAFPDASWASLWLGLEQWPATWDPMLDSYDFERLKQRFDEMKRLIDEAVSMMPMHDEFMARYCPPSG